MKTLKITLKSGVVISLNTKVAYTKGLNSWIHYSEGLFLLSPNFKHKETFKMVFDESAISYNVFLDDVLCKDVIKVARYSRLHLDGVIFEFNQLTNEDGFSFLNADFGDNVRVIEVV